MSNDSQTIIVAPPIPLADLPFASASPLDQNPAAAYLASLSEGSQRTLRTALTIIATLLGTPERLDDAGHDLRSLDVAWSHLRYQHTAAIRSALRCVIIAPVGYLKRCGSGLTTMCHNYNLIAMSITYEHEQGRPE